MDPLRARTLGRPWSPGPGSPFHGCGTRGFSGPIRATPHCLVTPTRAAFFVVLLALAAYANSLGNGFAYDDDGIITQNPVVSTGDGARALLGSWWPDPLDGGGLYRPVTLLSFVAEWKVFHGNPLGFHAVNVVFHVLVSLLVFVFLMEIGSVAGALAGGVLFAVHPLHTEVVANVVGRAELYAAFFYLLGCILYWRGRFWAGGARIARLLGLGVLYLLALGGKEIAVTLPGVLFLLEVYAPALRDGVRARGGEKEPAGTPVADRASDPGLPVRLAREAATFLLLGTVLLVYMGLRYLALDTFMGEIPAPIFLFVGPEARFLTALALWVQYVRLLIFPLDLAVDYDPGILFPSEVLDVPVIVGTLILTAWILLALRTRRGLPLVSFGLAWFVVTILPVSNLFFPTGVLLAERTLYLPSLGLSLVVAGLTDRALVFRYRRVLLGLAFLAALALLVRTMVRNPTWMSSFMVQSVLHEEHPESWRAIRAQAQGLERVGEMEEAGRAWDLAVRLAPMDYTLLVQAGDFNCRQGTWERCESYLRRAIDLAPGYRNAYQLLAGAMIRRDFGREGHRLALTGLARSQNDRELWALVSESYILKGDLPAAVRAREAAIAADPSAGYQWARLAEILGALGEEEQAARARSVADSLGPETMGEGVR